MAKTPRRGKPKPKEGTILVPLQYNDRTEVPQNVIQSIIEEIYLAFQGWTVEGIVEGAYRMKSGQKRVEKHLKVSIVLDRSQLPELEAMVARWCAQLGQEVMLLKIADFVIKFVPPQRERDEP